MTAKTKDLVLKVDSIFEHSTLIGWRSDVILHHVLLLREVTIELYNTTRHSRTILTDSKVSTRLILATRPPRFSSSIRSGRVALGISGSRFFLTARYCNHGTTTKICQVKSYQLLHSCTKKITFDKKHSRWNITLRKRRVMCHVTSLNFGKQVIISH